MTDQYYYVNSSSGTITITLPASNTFTYTNVSNIITIPATTYTGVYPNLIYTVGGAACITPGDLSAPQPKAVAKKKEAGCNCKRCNELNEYAEPNQDDGSFICYACRKGC